MPSFNPEPDEKITIGRETYRVSPHPSVPTFAFGQEGRKAFVFQLAHTKHHKYYALKKFKEAFRFPELNDICLALAQYAHLPGMGVCRRDCLVGPDYKNVLREYPDMEYAVLMPWMHGSTWYDFIVGQTSLDRESSLQMAWKTSEVLTGLEKGGLAHCDIAGANVIIDMAAGEVHLVDVEDMYAPGMPHPQAVPAGTDGYNHLTADAGLWHAQADRFAGAVLLAEMLGWHNPAVRDLADDEHYFALQTMQQDSDAYRLLLGTLYDTSPALADLFERAWFSPTLDDCPPLAEWVRVLDPLARPSPVAEWVPLVGTPVPAAPHPGNWEASQPAAPQETSVEGPPLDDVGGSQDDVLPALPEPDLPSVSQQPIAPLPAADGGGPLIGFRPLDLSSVISTSSPAATERTPIEPPPDTDADRPQAGSRPIEVPPPDVTLEETVPARPIDIPRRAEDASPEDTEPLPVEPAQAASHGDDRTGEPDERAAPVRAERLPTRPILRLPDFLKRRGPDETQPMPALPAPDDVRASAPEPEDKAVDSPLLIAPPDPPRLRSHPQDEAGSYVLFWGAVPEATSYVLQESTHMSFSDGRQATVRDATEWPVSHRSPGTYYYRVRAHSEHDFSDWSNIVFVKVEVEDGQGDG